MRADRFPGWGVVVSSFVCLLVTAGFGFYGLAAYLTALSNERGWSVGTISGAVAVFFLVSGASGLLIARLMAARDARVVIMIGAVVGAIALLLLGRVHEVWQVYAVYALFAIGHSFAGLIPATTVVTRWFHAKRSTALSIASTGLSVGGIVITPFVKWGLDRYELQATSPWLAAGWLVGLVPITLLLMKPDPTALGWQPDGLRVVADAPPVVLSGTTYREAVQSRFFKSVTVAYVFLLGSQVGGIQHLVKLVEERLGAGSAAAATSVLAAASVISRLIGGQAAARLPMTRLTTGLAVAQGVSLLLISQFESRLLLFAVIALFGATVGNILMLQPLLIGQRFGVLDYPKIFSRSQFVALVGTAFGPYLLGFLHDNAGGYGTSYLTAGVLSFVGAALIATAGPAEQRAGR